MALPNNLPTFIMLGLTAGGSLVGGAVTWGHVTSSVEALAGRVDVQSRISAAHTLQLNTDEKLIVAQNQKMDDAIERLARIERKEDQIAVEQRK